MTFKHTFQSGKVATIEVNEICDRREMKGKGTYLTRLSEMEQKTSNLNHRFHPDKPS